MNDIESAGGAHNNRYDLVIHCDMDRESRLFVFDHVRCHSLLQWRGQLVDRLLSGGLMPESMRQSGCYACDKTTVRHLILAGTVIQMSLEHDSAACSAERSVEPVGNTNSRATLDLQMRLRGVRLQGIDRLVVSVLFAHPGLHLSQADIASLMAMDSPVFVESHLPICLERLVDNQVIQRIQVNSEYTFYDIDTRPHVHIFDPTTGELHDAQAEGVVWKDGTAGVVQITTDDQSLTAQPSHSRCWE